MKLENMYGSGPYAERLEGSTPSMGTKNDCSQYNFLLKYLYERINHSKEIYQKR